MSENVTAVPPNEWLRAARQWLHRPVAVALVLEIDHETRKIVSWRTETLEDIAAIVEGLEVISNSQED